MISRIDHVGIAVKNLEESLKLYTDVLGMRLECIEVLESQKVRTAILSAGESKIELLESTSPDGVIARFIEQKGEGIHHLALGTDDVRAALKELQAKNIPLVDKEPRSGVQNTSIGFLHPKGAKILLELVESPDRKREKPGK